VLEDEGFEGVHASEKEVAKKKRKSWESQRQEKGN
jgi:hypothetical protein